MRRSATIILLVFAVGCSDQSSNDSTILGKEKMQAVMWDMLKSNAYTTHFIKNDTLRNPLIENMKLQQQIFAFHKISKEQFFNSYNFYSSKPDMIQPLLDSVMAMGEREKIRMIEKRGSESVK